MPRKKVSPSSRKDDILQAYHELLAEVETMDKKEAATPEEKEKEKLLAQAGAYTVENITKSIAKLTEKLKSEAEKFTALREAVKQEKKDLEILHQIRVKIATLKNLVHVQRAKEQEWEESDKRREAERSRNEEEYRYQTELRRRKEENQYQEEKAKKWKEFEEKIADKRVELVSREENIAAAEKELQELREKVESFPVELTAKVEAARKEAREAAQREAKIESNLLAKEVESESKLHQQKIATLEQTAKNQAAEIVSLKASLEKATRQIKDIAVKVIEGQSAPPKPRDTEEKPTQ